MSTSELLPSGKPRRPLRPLYGIPERDPRGRTGFLLSTLFHVTIIVLLLLPPVIASSIVFEESTGGGGPTRAGGGGGGTGGSGGETKPEKLRYLQVAPIPKVSPASITPPVVPPPKPPEVKPPEPTTPTPSPEPVAAPISGPTIPTPGAGGGSGHDGSGGNGSGTGGGVGTGTGTGRGSGNGPGTGGGPGENYPPKVQNLSMLPMPVPSRVRPYTLVAVFDVDERGNAQLLAFNPSRDSGYNRKIREMLSELRFRAGSRADGTPVRDTASITWSAPN